MSFKVGDKVKCIKDTMFGTIKQGEKLAIKKVFIVENKLGLLFIEKLPSKGVAGFNAINFKKL